jgi:hypothetical protein
LASRTSAEVLRRRGVTGLHACGSIDQISRRRVRHWSSSHAATVSLWSRCRITGERSAAWCAEGRSVCPQSIRPSGHAGAAADLLRRSERLVRPGEAQRPPRSSS